MIKNNNEKSNTVYYLDKHDEYIKKFGKERTLVLMQVGSFYETYYTGTRGPKLDILEELTGATIAHKGKDKSIINLQNPLMWGFPMVAKLKYFGILIDNGFKLIIIDQVTPPPNIKREVVSILSPSTYLDANYKPNSNFIVNLYIEETIQPNGKTLACIGMSAIDVSTGDVYLHESYSSHNDNDLGLDETIRFINGLVPKEIIINCENLKRLNEKYISDYLELDGKLHQFKDINKDHCKINYQKKLFEMVYPDRENMVSIIDTLGISDKHYCRLSLVFLLTYVSDHFESLVKGIKDPIFHLQDTRLILGNDAINQLDIVEKKNNTMLHGSIKYHNLLDVVNKANTAMGKRFIKMILISPLTNPKKLNTIYDIVDIMCNNNYYTEIITYLKSISDVERLYRKIELQMLHPMHIIEFINSFEKSLTMLSYMKKNKELTKFIKTAPLRKSIKSLNKYINKYIDKNKAKNYTLTEIKENIFNDGIYPELDKLQEKIGMGHEEMEELVSELNQLIDDNKSSGNKINLKHNKKDGFYFQLTKKRYELLSMSLENLDYIKLKNKNIKVSDFQIKETTGSIKIFLPMLKMQTDDIEELIQEIMNYTHNKYIILLKNIVLKYDKIIQETISIITDIDYYATIAKVSKLYNYTRPNIIDRKNKTSYISAKQIRHPIVERIIEHEYIPHDINIGIDLKGMMIYGLNSAGKSVLMKAIGISIILAQAGFYVPAKSFEYYPYKALYTRITGNDNLFRGLSSFTLEIIELNAILKRANDKTLVIGDEVCRGTEHISGNAIVATTLLKLSELGSTFVFATHLHELMKLDEIREKNDIEAYHLSVDIDINNDKLIYDRRLKPGSGERIYGIIVAKHIIKNSDFIKKALEIKNRLLDKDPESSSISTKSSRYNSELLVDKCELCGERNTNKKPTPLETHHINYQKNCKNGFVIDKPHIRKNQIFNLVVLCQLCHDKVHQGEEDIDSIKMTSYGKKLILKKK